MNAIAHQTRLHKAPRRTDWSHESYTRTDRDNPCARCGNCIHRITEKYRVGGPIRPAFMGPEEYEVFVDCNACGHSIDYYVDA